MKSRVVVSAIIKKGDKYLFGRKQKDIGPYPNTWVILGGGVDLEKESLEEAIRREIKEEANIEITKLKQLPFGEDYEPDKNGEKTHYVFLLYEAKYKSGEIKPGDDIISLQWFDKKDLSTIKLSRPTIKLFKKIGLIF